MNKLILLVCCILYSISSYAQFNCTAGANNSCLTSYTLNVAPGENITNKLKDALDDYCEVRIPNNFQGATYLITPTVFSGNLTNPNTSLTNKRIVLESGVVLQSVVGGTNFCSQSVFTFDGAGNQNITILGEYQTCEDRPVIRMPDTYYSADDDTGYLVASDDQGEPYLNANGQPNYVYSDFDNDPYFDNNGNPNLITPSTPFPPVPADCDYNFNLCNRTIIVWCPLNWEGRHIIAVHGAQNMTIQGVDIAYSAGGDGIVLASDEDGIPAANILIDDVQFYNNARTGVNVVNANCATIDASYFENTGDQAGLQSFVTTRGGVAFQTNPTNGLPSVLEQITLSNSSFLNNLNNGVKTHVPSILTDPLEISIDQVCIAGSDTGLLFDETLSNTSGLLAINNVAVSNAAIGMHFTSQWQSNGINIAIDNLDLSSSDIQTDVIIDNASSFCNNFTAVDVCLGNSNTICQQSISCNANNNHTCAENCGSSECDCENTKDVTVCEGNSVTLEVAVDIPDIFVDRPLASPNWNNQLETNHCCLDGDVELCFTLSEATGRSRQVFGITTDPDASAHYNTIDYGLWIYKTPNSNVPYIVRVYENGVFKKNVNYSNDLLGAQFCVKRVGGEVSYFVDGTSIYTSGTNSNDPLCYDNSFFSSNNSAWHGSSGFSDITYKITSNNAVTWTPNVGTGATVVVTPTSNTTYVASFPSGNGCDNHFTTNVIIASDLEVDLSTEGELNCAGGAVEICATDDPNYEYEWTTGETSSCIDVDLPDTYCVTVTDVIAGCNTTECITIDGDLTLPEVEISTTCDILITLSTQNLNNYTYLWSTGAITPEVTALVADEYCVTVTDETTGCSDIDCFEVTQSAIDVCWCDGGNYWGAHTLSGGTEGGEIIIPALSPGTNLCWSLTPDWPGPAGITISAGSTVYVETGPVTSHGNWNSPCNNTIGIGDYGQGECIELPVGEAQVFLVGDGPNYITGSFTVSTTGVPIIFNIDGEPCGSGFESDWYVDIACCEGLLYCNGGRTPINLRCWDNVTSTDLSWSYVQGATGYEIEITQDCCDDPDPNFGTVTIYVENTYLVEPSFLPECYTWRVRMVDDTGATYPWSNPMCMDEDTECSEGWEPDPCDDYPDPPEVECNENEEDGTFTLSWPVDPNASFYTITIIEGVSECCPNSTNQSTSIYQMEDTELSLEGLDAGCFTYIVESFCEDMSSSSVTGPICVSDLMPCGQTFGCEVTPSGQTTLVWDEIPGAVGFNIMIVPGGPCCEENEPEPVPFFTCTTDPVSFPIPDDFPPCFSWSIQTIGANGETSPFSPPVCMGPETECVEVPEPDVDPNPEHDPTLEEHVQVDGEIGDDSPCNDRIDPRDNSEDTFVKTNRFSVKAFPNPTRDLLNVNLTSQISGMVTVRFFNSNGSTLSQSNSFEAIKGTNTFEVSIDDLTPGLYIMKVQLGSDEVIKKIIVME